MKQRILYLLSLLLVCSFVYAQSSMTIQCEKPGKLSKMLKGKENVSSLIISGKLDGKDIEFINALSNLEQLDLRDAEIEDGYQYTIVDGKTKHKLYIRDKTLLFAPSNTIKELHIPFKFYIESMPHALKVANIKTAKEYQVANIQNLYIHSINRNFDYGRYRGGLNARNLHLDGILESSDWEKTLAYLSVLDHRNMYVTKWKGVGLLVREQEKPEFDTLSLSVYPDLQSSTFRIGNLPESKVLVYKDKKILSHWLEEKSDITREDLSGFDAIMAGAFDGHHEIKTVTLPNNIKIIPVNCFKDCNIESITMDSVEYIFDNAFSASQITFNMKEPPAFQNMYHYDEIFNMAEIRIPKGTRKQYQLGNWKNYVVHEDGEKNNYEFIVEKPGILNQYITDNVIQTAQNISLTGILYDTDIDVLNKCKGIKNLDISKTLILKSPATIQKEEEDSKAFLSLLGGLTNMAAKNAQKKYDYGVGNLADAVGTKAIADFFNEASKNISNKKITPNKDCLLPRLDMPQLEEIHLPIFLKHLGHGIKHHKKLRRIILPPALETLDTDAFSGCMSLDSISLPGTVKAFVYDQYSNEENKNLCSLKYVDLSQTQLTEIPMGWLGETGGDMEYISFPKTLKEFELDIELGYSNCDIYVPLEEGSLRYIYPSKGNTITRVHVPKGCKAGWTTHDSHPITIIDDL